MLASCQKEETEAGSTLKLFAEGFKGDSSKMTVDHGQTYWSNNDTVRVNGYSYAVAVSNTNSNSVSISGFNSRAFTYPLRAISPASLCREVDLTEDQVQITLPAVYQYDQVVYDANTSRQVLNAPMAAYATEGNELHFKHLTGALAVKITNTTGAQISLERIKVVSTAAKLNGTFTFNFTDLTSISPVRSSTDDERMVTMRFDNQEKVIGNGRTVYIQIPVPPVGNANKFRIVVEYRHKGAAYVGRRCCYTFNKQQSNAGALNRAELGYVPVTAPTHGEDEGMYFFMDDDGYNIIRNIYDLQTFATINLANEIGTQKYRITKDIDASGYTFDPIVIDPSIGDFELNGSGHTISNITFTTTPTSSSVGYCGMFKNLYTSSGYPRYIHHLTLADATLNVASNAVHVGALAARTGSTTLRKCRVLNLTYNLQANNSKPDKYMGGLIGRHEKGGLVIDSCEVSGATFQYNNYQFLQKLYFGGLVGWDNVSFTDQGDPRHEFTECKVTFDANSPCTLQSPTTTFGGILGYSNTTTLNSSTMNFSGFRIGVPRGSLHVKSTVNDVYVGAMIGKTSSSLVFDNNNFMNCVPNESYVYADCPAGNTYFTGGRYYLYRGNIYGVIGQTGCTNGDDRRYGLIGSKDANGAWHRRSAENVFLENWKVIIYDGVPQ